MATLSDMVSLWARRSAVMGTGTVMAVPGAVKPDARGRGSAARAALGWIATAPGFVLHESRAFAIGARRTDQNDAHARKHGTLHVRSIRPARHARGADEIATMGIDLARRIVD